MGAAPEGSDLPSSDEVTSLPREVRAAEVDELAGEAEGDWIAEFVRSGADGEQSGVTEGPRLLDAGGESDAVSAEDAASDAGEDEDADADAA